MKRVASTLIAAISIAALSIAAAPAPVISTPNGRLAGATLGDGTRVFKGIPYARAPVGDLRWKPPVPVARWTATRAASTFGAACMQPGSAPTSIYRDIPPSMGEDCLSLNVWTPKAAAKAPVMVWIHGGSLIGGHGGSPMYDGAKLAARGVVVVTVNYRLGVLGFLAHPGLSAESPDRASGNYGLLDQIEALRWVKANIAAFGGDPANVTIMGESAGALSVTALLASPLARGLYAKAIAESAYLISVPALGTKEHGTPSAEQVGTLVAAAFKTSDVKALRALPAETLIATAPKLGYVPWPTVDGHVLTKQLVDTFDAGEQARVPILAGFNAGEIRTLRFLAPPVPTDPKAYETTIRANYGALADAFLTLYPPTDLDGSVFAATRDGLYGWSAQRLADKQAAAGRNAFLYYFDHSYPAADAAGIPAFHAAEIPYVFGLIGGKLPVNWPAAPDTARERTLSDAMVGYWTSFAKTGVPAAEGQPTWRPYADGRSFMLFKDRPQSGREVLPGAYELAEEVICRRRRAGNQPWLANIGLAAGPVPATPCARPVAR